MDALRIKMNSIRSRLILFVGSGLICAGILYLILNSLIDYFLMELMIPRPDAIAFTAGLSVAVTINDSINISPQITNESLFYSLKVIRTISPVIIFSLSLIITTFLFYRFTLHKPLEMLRIGINKISNKDLEFIMENNCSNELGQICGAFESMRKELVRAFESLWKSEENQRSLYRAFAHDLRTPLSVIKGNNDNIELIAVRKNDWELVLQAVALSNHAVERIQLYAEQLKELESMDALRPVYKEIELKWLADIICRQAELLGGMKDKNIESSVQVNGFGKIDKNILLRILDNLILNALRYARYKVILSISTDGVGLKITICDDGPGFLPEALGKAFDPFYTTERLDGHIGLGLTVSLKLLQKCEGQLLLQNLEQGGACVSLFLPV